MAAPAKNEKDLASLVEDIATHTYISDRAVLRRDVRSAQNTTLVIGQCRSGAGGSPRTDDHWVMSQPEVQMPEIRPFASNASHKCTGSTY